MVRRWMKTSCRGVLCLSEVRSYVAALYIAVDGHMQRLPMV
jgi:hypothetical protein